jgi:hypothetical protein
MPGTLLTYAESSPGTIVFSVQGTSTGLEMGNFEDAVEARLEKAGERIRKIVFDLSATDPVVNAAGRIFDVAVQCRDQLDRGTTAIEIIMPREVYKDLQRTDDLPQDVGQEVIVKGVKIVLVESTYLEPRKDPRLHDEDILRLSYTGKVREVLGGRITVSLFTEEGEVVGELASSQFPDDVVPSIGQVFLYRTAVTERGRTEVVVEPIEERELSADEIIDIWERTNAEIPLDGPPGSEET